MVALLTAQFQPAVSVTLERFRFNKRDHRVGESVPDYVAALRSLAQTCAFDIWLEPLLRDRLICGLCDEGLQRRLLAELDLTWERAVKLVRAAEAAKQQSAELHPSSVDASSVHSIPVRGRVCTSTSQDISKTTPSWWLTPTRSGGGAQHIVCGSHK